MPGPRMPAEPWLRWEPIETIPNDGGAYLAVNDRVQGGFPQVVFWDNYRLHVPDSHIHYALKFFTHWARIPLPQT